MNLTDEQLDKIEEYASCFMTWQQIAVMIEVPEPDFKEEMSDRLSAAFKRYLKGQTKSHYEINKSITRLAKMGSPQAEMLVRSDILRQSNAENDL